MINDDFWHLFIYLYESDKSTSLGNYFEIRHVCVALKVCFEIKSIKDYPLIVTHEIRFTEVRISFFVKNR